MFETLLSPITINKTVIKNRIIYPALGLLYSYDQKLNDRFINFYRERAKGGAGIVTVGPIGFDDVGAGIAAPNISFDDAMPEFKRLAKAIKDEGAKSWVQLYHAGAYTYPFLIPGKQALAPSAIYSKYTKETPKEMTIDDIKGVQEAFVKGAERVKEAGFDGVEIIASAGYLITQFLSPLKNQRTDEYGGSFENRIRFAREIIEETRKRVGPDFPISMRMAGNDFVPGSNTDNETPEFAKVYEKAGVDLINVTGGWHESRVPQLPMVLPRGAFSYLAENIKRAVNIPVVASNRITNPHLAETILNDGVSDMISLGRVLLADPYWVKKAEQGLQDEIRPCVACSQGCTDNLFGGKPVACSVNPRVGFEGERLVTKTDSPKNVMIVGAGPGGLEAAITAKECGHNVEIYEKKDEIGGQLWIAGTPPHKQELWEIVKYYDEMLLKYDIPVYLETEVDMDFIKEKNPDYIIAAEGAEPVVPPIKGFDSEDVLSAWDILDRDLPLGRKVAVIGGGAVGLETAEFIAEKGTISPETLYFLMKYDAESPERLKELISKGSKDVTIFEMMPKVGKGVGRSTKWILLTNIDKAGIEVVTDAKVLSVENGKITFEKGGKEEVLEFDNVINAVGSKSVRTIADKLEKIGIPFSIVGDSVEPAQFQDAIHGGFLAAVGIG